MTTVKYKISEGSIPFLSGVCSRPLENVVSKQVTTTAKSGLIADNQYGKIYGSSPGGPTENQALTSNDVGAFFFAKNFEQKWASFNMICVINLKSIL